MKMAMAKSVASFAENRQYREWVKSLKTKIRRAQAKSVDEALFYVGKTAVERRPCQVLQLPRQEGASCLARGSSVIDLGVAA